MNATTPYELSVFFGRLEEAGCGPVRETGGGEFRSRCPAHDDGGPSLYTRVIDDKILVRCAAGCEFHDILDRLDLTPVDLRLENDESVVDLDGGRDGDDGVESVVPVNDEDTSHDSTDADTANFLNVVYKSLLDDLELSSAHFDDLKARGFSAADIQKLGYRTADPALLRAAVDRLLAAYGREVLLNVPGFEQRNGRVVFTARQGILIPERDLFGRVKGIKVRHDADYAGPKYTGMSRKENAGAAVAHVPLGTPKQCTEARLTEGEFKADLSFVLDGVPTVSGPGVSNWGLAVPVLRAMGVSRVRIAMDQDGKAGTLAAIEQAVIGLADEGFEVVVEWWDGAVAKGIDDLLAAGGRPEVLDGLNTLARMRRLRAEPRDEAEVPAAPPAPFPVDVFPPALADYCRQVAAATATSADFAGTAILATAASAIGNSRALVVKDGSWVEAPRLYIANVGEPSSGKTPSTDIVLQPYQQIQFELLANYKAALEEFEQSQDEYDRCLKENRTVPADERQPLPPEPTKPPRPERTIVRDATVESLAPLLERNPRGLLMPCDELVAWVRSQGQYKGGRGNDRQFWLSTFSGSPHFVDRKSQDGIPVSISRPFVNVIGNLPPDMVGELTDANGRSDGFLHRILFAFPDAAPAAAWTDATISPAASQTWEDTLHRLRALDMTESADGVLGHRPIHFGPHGKAAWVAWWDRHAAEMQHPAFPPELYGPWGKLRTYAARFAVVLHYLFVLHGDETEGKVSADTIDRVVRLIDYFKSHVRRVYARLQRTPQDEQVERVLAWVRQRGGECTARDLVRSKIVTPTDAARKVLRELAAVGYGRTEVRNATKGNKTEWFVLDPG
jgi:hypothetical protein